MPDFPMSFKVGNHPPRSMINRGKSSCGGVDFKEREHQLPSRKIQGASLAKSAFNGQSLCFPAEFGRGKRRRNGKKITDCEKQRGETA